MAEFPLPQNCMRSRALREARALSVAPAAAPTSAFRSPRLCRAVAYETTALCPRLQTTLPVFAIDESEIAGALRLRNPGVELGNQCFRPL